MDAQELNVALQRVRAYLDAGEVKTLISTAYAPTEDRLWGDDLRALVDALTERAVSPAESVQSDDLLKLQDLIGEVCRKYNQASYTNKQTDDVVAFGRAEKLLIEYIDASRAAAHAEGRRSAMEELAKEKERADKAEALAAKYDVELDGAISTRDYYHEMADKLAQAIAEYFDADIGEHSSANCPWREALVVIEEAPPRKPLTKAEIAARQAPDWTDKQIMALWTQCNMPSEENDFTTGPLPFARAILAQPLQQEGGKEAAITAVVEKLRNLDAGVWSRGGIDQRKLIAAILEAAQPSDNLQQASTAQVEPAKTPYTDKCGVSWESKEAHDSAVAKEAATATDEQQLSMSMFASVEDYNAAKAAQATPEGADLPPLPEPAYQGVMLEDDESAYTADQMRTYALDAIRNLAGGKNG